MSFAGFSPFLVPNFLEMLMTRTVTLNLTHYYIESQVRNRTLSVSCSVQTGISWTNCLYDFTQNWSTVGEWTLQQSVADSPCPSLGYKTWAELQQLMTAMDCGLHFSWEGFNQKHWMTLAKFSLWHCFPFWFSEHCRTLPSIKDWMRSTDLYRGVFCQSILPTDVVKRIPVKPGCVLIQLSVARMIGFLYFVST